MFDVMAGAEKTGLSDMARNLNAKEVRLNDHGRFVCKSPNRC